MSVEFIDHRPEVKLKIAQIAESMVRECCGELEAQVKRNTRVNTGRTKNSWTYMLNESHNSIEGIVGSDYQNAVWEEFGTGEEALNHDGRRGGWRYKVGDAWYFTRGKKGTRALYNAFTQLKDKLIRHTQEAFRNL